MNNVIINYRDKNCARGERFNAGPYHPDSVQQMTGLLRMMGCIDFKFIPTQDQALAIPCEE